MTTAPPTTNVQGRAGEEVWCLLVNRDHHRAKGWWVAMRWWKKTIGVKVPVIIQISTGEERGTVFTRAER